MKRKWPVIVALMLALMLLTSASAAVSLPGNTDTIAQEAFRGDTSLGKVELPEGIRRIEARAFAYSGVKEINLPETLESIADDAFEGCSKNLVIRGVRGGKAEAYCKKNKLTFALSDPRVGISLPTNVANYWVNASNAFKKGLDAGKIKADIRYAQGDARTQAEQIRALVSDGIDVLVFVPVGNDGVANAIEEAGKAGVRIISCQRLFYDSQYVDYYASFSDDQIGAAQGRFVKEYCKLDTIEGSINIEFFGGDKSDDNARVFFESAYDQVEPYLRSGKLVCPSGETTLDKAYTDDWTAGNAYERMKRLIEEQYPNAPRSGKCPDIVLCCNDSIALGVIQALKDAGFSAQDMPVITGQDCDIQNVRFIRDGFQTMSIFKNGDALAQRVVDACVDLVNGRVPETDGTIHNGAKEVPFLPVAPDIATKDNYGKLLVESGLYSREALEG